MEKTYQFEVKIISDCFIPAKNEKEAIRRLKDTWFDENNIELEAGEFSLIAVEKVKTNKDGTKDITID